MVSICCITSSCLLLLVQQLLGEVAFWRMCAIKRALRMPGQAKWDRNLDRGGKASVGIVDVELTAGKPGNIVTGYALQPDLLSDDFDCRGGIDPAVIVGRPIGDGLVVDVLGF